MRYPLPSLAGCGGRRLPLLLTTFIIALQFGCAVVAPQQKAPRAPAEIQAPSPPAATTRPVPAPTADDRIERPTSDPYTGELSIFEGRNREKNLQIGRVMDILGIREGSGVADIGAGSGWFTVRAAQRAGATGKVYAVEINPAYVRHIEKRAEKERLSNILPILGTEDDPRLHPESVDAVMILKTYHEIGQPIRLLTHLRRAMRAGARLGIIDRNGDGADHGIDRAKVIEEAGRAGFTLVEEHDFVKPDGMDYFLVFRVT